MSLSFQELAGTMRAMELTTEERAVTALVEAQLRLLLEGQAGPLTEAHREGVLAGIQLASIVLAENNTEPNVSTNDIGEAFGYIARAASELVI